MMEESGTELLFSILFPTRSTSRDTHTKTTYTNQNHLCREMDEIYANLSMTCTIHNLFREPRD